MKADEHHGSDHVSELDLESRVRVEVHHLQVRVEVDEQDFDRVGRVAVKELAQRLVGKLFPFHGVTGAHVSRVSLRGSEQQHQPAVYECDVLVQLRRRTNAEIQATFAERWAKNTELMQRLIESAVGYEDLDVAAKDTVTDMAMAASTSQLDGALAETPPEQLELTTGGVVVNSDAIQCMDEEDMDEDEEQAETPSDEAGSGLPAGFPDDPMPPSGG